MKCLRCGWCCTNYWVVILSDGRRPAKPGNLEVHPGHGPCKHLRGKTPGKHRCSIHGSRYYKGTPCDRHGQIEASPKCVCRMGRYMLKQYKKACREVTS